MVSGNLSLNFFYGKGKVADIILYATYTTNSETDLKKKASKTTLLIKFPNEGDGYIGYKQEDLIFINNRIQI